MNIFILDYDVVLSAQYHVDAHVVKMPLELAQLLCTCHHEYGTNTDDMYKSTHVNHPCAKWVRESKSNYLYTYQLFIALLDEYTHRYGKIHGCSKLIDSLSVAPHNMPDVGATPFAQAMPDDCKCADSVRAYRNYYMKYKRHLIGWRKRFDPPWFD